MKRPPRLQQGIGALDLIEETVHALRLAPPAALLSYYVGSLPFILGLLYFWADMSRSAFAEQRLPAAAFGLTLLFIWMKTWQSVFAHRMLAQLCHEPSPRCTLARLGGAALVQGILQPSGLFVLLVAAVLLLPLGWVYAFYQNLTVLGTGETTEVRKLVRQAWRQAKLWPRQNHAALAIFKLFGFVVFLNLITGFLAVPLLLKSLLGVETVFTQSYWAVLNPTFFAVIAGLTYLCLDPLLKTFYVLRCFYGESLQTGQDLKTELRGLLPASKLASGALVLTLLVTAAPRSLGAEPPDPPRGAELETQHPALATRNAKPDTRNSVSPAALDRTMRQVIDQSEFNWRLPREETSSGSKSATGITEWIRFVFEVIGDWIKSATEWFGNLLRKLFRPPSLNPPSVPLAQWLSRLHTLLIVLIVACAAILAVFLFRMWQRRRRRPADEIRAQAVQPDLASEDVSADQLPEDGWMKLARELLSQGELRLALRALYLASLAHLAQRGLIALAKFKSNRDYERELGRRAHALPELAGTFAENVSVFDRVWYGLHEVNPEMLGHFASNVERIKAGG